MQQFLDCFLRQRRDDLEHNYSNRGTFEVPSLKVKVRLSPTVLRAGLNYLEASITQAAYNPTT